MIKKYVFFSADIYPVGGIQLYLSGKTKYLQTKGIEVYVLFYSKQSNTVPAFPQLRKFVAGNFKFLSVYPNQLLEVDVKKSIEMIKSHIDYHEGDCIYIESNYDKTAIWAELFAASIKGKHICFNCNEVFRGKNKHYLDYIDYFWFKYNRRELYGISRLSMEMLFDGVYHVSPNDEDVFHAEPDESVQDVVNKDVSNIVRRKYNVSYIGRTDKDCFWDITKGVAEFVKKYNVSDINYIIVGKITGKDRRRVNELFERENLTCVFLGDLVPIPRSIFDKIDVVCASSGCASLAVEEKAITIVADPNSIYSNGVFGVDTDNFLYSENHYAYSDLLYQVLIEHRFDDIDVQVENTEDKEIYYSRQLKLFENHECDKTYFNLSDLTKNKRLISKGTLFYYLHKIKGMHI